MRKSVIQRAKAIVHDPIFDKPIQVTDYTKKGVIILVTKIKPKWTSTQN